MQPQEGCRYFYINKEGGEDRGFTIAKGRCCLKTGYEGDPFKDWWDKQEGTATLKAIGAPADILVETLTSAGFEVAVEQVSMSFGGHALPGKRDLYLALMHPTLG